MKNEIEATALTDRAQANPRRWAILGVMSLSTFMLMLDNTIVNTALPSMARDLRASTGEMQWIVDGYVLMLAGLLLVGGTIGDIFGRRRWFAAGMSIFGLASVGAGLSTSAEQLIAFRSLQGVGGALVMPATLSIITNVFPREERAKAIGVWTGVSALAMGMGPAFGGYLIDNTGWSSIFFLHVPLVLVALAGLAIVPESRDPRPRSLDVPGAVSGTVTLGALVFGIIGGGEHGWTDTQVLASLSLAAAAGIAFFIVERRAASPMLPMHFFRERDFTAGVVTVGTVFFAIAVVFFFLTQFYQLVQGRSAFEAGLLFLPSAFAMMIGAPISGLVVHRTGPKLLISSAVAVCAVAVALLSLVTADSSTLRIAANLALFGLAGGLGMAPLTDMVMAAVPVDDAGVGSALNDVSRELGAALGIAAVGSFVSSLYRGNVEAALAGTLPRDLVEPAGDGLGVATVLAQSLPADVQSTLIAAAQTGFVDALTTGFIVSAALLLGAAVFAAVAVPGKVRSHQAIDTGDASHVTHLDLAPVLQPAEA
jgi:EmrB/QacA subfamily drug resistance transporter